MLTIIVTVKSEGATRPSGHKLSSTVLRRHRLQRNFHLLTQSNTCRPVHEDTRPVS